MLPTSLVTRVERSPAFWPAKNRRRQLEQVGVDPVAQPGRRCAGPAGPRPRRRGRCRPAGPPAGPRARVRSAWPVQICGRAPPRTSTRRPAIRGMARLTAVETSISSRASGQVPVLALDQQVDGSRASAERSRRPHRSWGRRWPSANLPAGVRCRGRRGRSLAPLWRPCRRRAPEPRPRGALPGRWDCVILNGSASKYRSDGGRRGRRVPACERSAAGWSVRVGLCRRCPRRGDARLAVAGCGPGDGRGPRPDGRNRCSCSSSTTPADGQLLAGAGRGVGGGREIGRAVHLRQPPQRRRSARQADGARGFAVNEASYGSIVGEDTDICHWHGQVPRPDGPHPAHASGRTTLLPDGPAPTRSWPSSPATPTTASPGAGADPGDPDSCELTVANAKAAYRALLPDFAAAPRGAVRRLHGAAPGGAQAAGPEGRASRPCSREATESADLAREFNTWLADRRGRLAGRLRGPATWPSSTTTTS